MNVNPLAVMGRQPPPGTRTATFLRRFCLQLFTTHQEAFQNTTLLLELASELSILVL